MFNTLIRLNSILPNFARDDTILCESNQIDENPPKMSKNGESLFFFESLFNRSFGGQTGRVPLIDP